MKQLAKIVLLILGFAAVMSACSKREADLPFYYKGSSVILSSSLNTLAPAVADSNKPVLFLSWTDPKYATDSASIKYIVQVDNAGKNFSSPVTKEVTGARTAFFTARELNTMLINYGLGLGVPARLEARILSSYGNNNERYASNVLPVTVTPYADPATLVSSAASVTGTLATSASNALTFTWSPAFKAYTGDVNYVLQYDSSGKGFTLPVEMTIGIGKFSQAMTQADMNTAAINSGVKAGASGKVEYRIKSTTATGAVAYSNVVNVTVQTYIPILRLYVPGSYQAAAGLGANWDPPTAPEMIRDLRPAVLNKLYYAYMYFNANDEFKITQGRAWDINYGAATSTIPAAGATGSFGGNNFKITANGWYRVSIDISNNKYDIRPGRMGFVGGATGAGWNPPNVFPDYALGSPANNLFVGITGLTVDGWKLIDNNAWNNGSNTVDETRSYGAAGGPGSTLEVNGSNNFPNPSSPGRYRVIWDGRNVDNVKYEMSPATEMRVVGDGINGVAAWTPGASPQMTYAGNGKWTITIGLIGGKEIKFLAGNDWGAFDYEDNSGGSNATGVARKIKWEGGDNFKTPAASGTYTITLDENNQTVTIN
jgi:hypothetical protein